MLSHNMFWNRWTILLSLFFFAFASTACTAPLSKTEEALKYADALQVAIDAFEQARSQTSTKIEEVSDKVVEAAAPALGEELANPAETTATPTDQDNDANPETIELTGLAKTWETEWKTVHTEFEALEDHFSAVGKSSQKYFDELQKITEEISDPNIKAEEQEKNQQLKDAWVIAYDQAATDIAKLREVINRGDDFALVLLGAALRHELLKDMKDLQALSTQAQELLVKLEQLIIEGRNLTGGQKGIGL